MAFQIYNFPTSPQMKQARGRLDDLLQGIRVSSAPDPDSDVSMDEDEFDQMYYENLGQNKTPTKRAYHRRKPIIKREKKVVFELRGKPFELQEENCDESRSLFRLARLWLEGKDNTHDVSQHSVNVKSDSKDFIDKGQEDKGPENYLSNGREIDKLPPPGPVDPLISNVPPIITNDTQQENIDLSSRQSILNSYAPHWKRVKRIWIRHSHVKAGRFETSLDMLSAIYDMAQEGNNNNN